MAEDGVLHPRQPRRCRRSEHESPREVVTSMSIFFWRSTRKSLSSLPSGKASRQTAKRRPLHSRRLELERLEDRVLLSAEPVATPDYIIHKPPAAQPYQS